MNRIKKHLAALRLLWAALRFQFIKRRKIKEHPAAEDLFRNDQHGCCFECDNYYYKGKRTDLFCSDRCMNKFNKSLGI